MTRVCCPINEIIKKIYHQKPLRHLKHKRYCKHPNNIESLLLNFFNHYIRNRDINDIFNKSFVHDLHAIMSTVETFLPSKMGREVNLGWCLGHIHL